MAKLPVDKIIVGERTRKDLGDLGRLMRSIDQHGGLLQPIVVTSNNELVAGERRLRAWSMSKCAGQEIPVHIVEIDAIASGELTENIERKPFTISEIVAIKRRVMPVYAAKAKERQIEAAVHGKEGGRGHKKTLGGISPKGLREPRASDRVAEYVGIDRRTLEKAEAVVSAAEADPETFGPLVELMDTTGKVQPAYNKYKELRPALSASTTSRSETVAETARGDKARTGKTYNVVILDIHWHQKQQVDDLLVEINKTLPPSMVAINAAVWLWAPPVHLRSAYHLLDQLGFTPKIVHTYVKNIDMRGPGRTLLTSEIEFCIVGSRGELPTNFQMRKAYAFGGGRVRAKQHRPLEFYLLVEELCPSRLWLEVFPHGDFQRSYWHTLGSKTEAA